MRSELRGGGRRRSCARRATGSPRVGYGEAGRRRRGPPPRLPAPPARVGGGVRAGADARGARAWCGRAGSRRPGRRYLAPDGDGSSATVEPHSGRTATTCACSPRPSRAGRAPARALAGRGRPRARAGCGSCWTRCAGRASRWPPCSMPMGGRVIAPVGRLTDAIEHVAATDDLSLRVGASGDDEVGRLGAPLRRHARGAAALATRWTGPPPRSASSWPTPRTSCARRSRAYARTSVLLSEGAVTDPEGAAAGCWSTSSHQADELSALVTDVVELARGDQRGREPEDVRLDSHLAEEAVVRARLHAPAGRGCGPTWSRVAVEGVPDRLARALNNLLDNAVKHSPTGAPVEVTLRGGNLEVRDHGLAPHRRPRAFFDRFSAATPRRAQGGSGLGLAIVRQVVDAHGATVEAATPPAAGSSSGSPSRRLMRPRAACLFGLPNFARGLGVRFGKNGGNRTGSPIPSRLGATNERHIQHLRRSRRPQRASAGLTAAPAVADARPLHARAPGRARAALPPGGGGPRRLRDRGHERRHAARLGGRGLRPMDVDRVLDPQGDLPLRARGRARCALPLDRPRRAPRPPERSAPAGDAAVGLRAAVNAVLHRLSGRCSERRSGTRSGPASWRATCSTT